MVDIFFIRRLWILSNHSYILTVTPSILLAGRIGCHTAAGVLALTTGVWADLRANRGPNIAVETANVLSAVIDGMIAISLIYFLSRRQSGQDRTDGIVRWLMGYAVNSGAIMMIVSLTITITYAKVQESLLFVGLVIAVGKIYANSLLGSLNARRFLRDMHTHNTAVGSKSSPIELSRIQASSTQRPIEIYREKTQITDHISSHPVDMSDDSRWELHTTTIDDDDSSHRKEKPPTTA
ncbi:hypothetical protein QCA50_007838 [Cerrena zonata]|uniref:DUF6534 domain-containing protein n=1 Tax=Cerrena zonata TaxID=2478898 RepID=A0AAW0GC72_9APHY